jgi:serine-type D-Ala-D-Ala carboxypeptidase (penicillin-binding protein 5/6)
MIRARPPARAALGACLLSLVALLLFAAPGARGATPPPKIDAPAAIVMETSTGDVPYKLNDREPRPIASTTKLMTALLTLKRAKLDDVYTSPGYDGDPAESIIDLQAGEKLTVRDLFRGLMLASANDAAATLARGISGTTAAFVRLMNREARRLGLDETSYANPIGLDDPDNYSTPRDLARLAIVLRRNRFARETMDLPGATLRTGNEPRRLKNRNVLVRRIPIVNGVKTGHTNLAGYILVGSATRKGVTVVSVVLGEPSANARDADSIALLDYGLDRYKRVRPVRTGQLVGHATVRYGAGASTQLVAGASFRRVVRRGRKVTVTPVGLPAELEGPLPAGRRAGTLVVRAGNRVVARVPVVTGEPVPPPKKLEQAKEAVLRPVVLIPAVVLVVVVGSLLVAGVTRRRRAKSAERQARRKTPA